MDKVLIEDSNGSDAYKSLKEIGYKDKDFDPDNICQAIEARMDDFFSYIFENFAIPNVASFSYRQKENSKVDYDFCQLITQGNLNYNQFERMFRTIPPIIPEMFWPVMPITFLLRHNRVAFNHRRLKTFKGFHDRYGPLILGW